MKSSSLNPTLLCQTSEGLPHPFEPEGRALRHLPTTGESIPGGREQLIQEKRVERFSKLLTATRPALRAHLSTQLRSREAVEDCLQEVALTVWLKYDEAWDEEQFRRFSFTCARFKVLGWLKQNDSKNLVVMAPEIAERIAERIESMWSGKEGEESERIAALENCVDEMPDRQRELLMCRYGPKEGGTLEDQARKLARSMDSIYKQLERLRSALRDCVEQRLSRA